MKPKTILKLLAIGLVLLAMAWVSNLPVSLDDEDEIDERTPVNWGASFPRADR